MKIVGVVPYGTSLLGIVMLPKPVSPLKPVTVKDTVVDVAW
jgi:hypothetical protein